MKLKQFLFATVILASSAAVLNAQQAEIKSLMKRADAFVVQENYRAAIEDYGKVPAHAGEAYARAIFNIAVCHYELWQTEEAIVFYRRAIELKAGNYPRASYALGVALEDQGKIADAREAYGQAIAASHNEFGPAIYKLGVLEAKASEFKKAAELFRNAAAREGRHVPASRNNLGVMLAQLGLLKQAEQEFVAALKQSNGALDDAAHNLKLCRALMITSRASGVQQMRLL